MSVLFNPLRVGDLELVNRIVIAPMCQYSAVDGCMTDWHVIHLGSLALSGAALLTVEATAVLPEGRITHADVGLWDDATEQAMMSTLASVRRWSDIPIALQLAHAGRKASTEVPWKGGNRSCPAPKTAGRPWLRRRTRFCPESGRRSRSITRGCGACARPSQAQPSALHAWASMRCSCTGRTVICCTSSSPRCRTAGRTSTAEASRTGCAFRSKYSTRSGSLSGESASEHALSGTDWVEGGWDIAQTLAFAQALAAHGCAAVHVSSGGLDPAQQIPVGPSYQVPLARAVKAAVRIPVVAVGLITEFEQAEAIVSTGDADLIALARTILFNPRWPWHAAAHFGAHVRAPEQYLRSRPRQYPDLFDIGH